MGSQSAVKPNEGFRRIREFWTGTPLRLRKMALALRFLALVLLAGFPSLEVNGATLEKIPGVDQVNQAIVGGGSLWVAADDGVCRIDRGRISWLTIGLQVNSLVYLDDILLLGTTGGLFKLENGDATREYSEQLGLHSITLLKKQADVLWVGTTRGLFKIVNGELEAIREVQGSVNVLEEIAGEIWVGTDRNAFWLSLTGIWRPVFDRRSRHPIWDIQEAGASIWLVIYGAMGRFDSFYEVVDGEPIRLFSLRDGLGVHEVTTVSDLAGEVWLGTTSGLHRLANTDLQPIGGGQVGPVNVVRDLGSAGLWIGTTRGALYRDGEEFVAVKGQGNVKDILLNGDDVVIVASDGLYRLQESAARKYVVILLALPIAALFVFAFRLWRRSRVRKVAGIERRS